MEPHRPTSSVRRDVVRDTHHHQQQRQISSPASNPVRSPFSPAHRNSRPSPTMVTVDVQTDSPSTTGMAAKQFKSITQTSNGNLPSQDSIPACASNLSQSKPVKLNKEDIAKYIEDKMKEQYMEQTRTLEQLQLQMKQQLLEKQAQLLQQLKSLDNQTSCSDQEQEDEQDKDSQPPVSTSPLSSINHNSNAADKSATEHIQDRGSNDGINGTMDIMSNSVTSADESVNGNMSQGSSHDTWDSSNAFAHERPVLTGSERSTPTPTFPSINSSNDLELISQSVHIPCDEPGSHAATTPSAPTLTTSLALAANGSASVALSNGVGGHSASRADVSTNLADTPRELSGGAVGQNDEDDKTPRNIPTATDAKVSSDNGAIDMEFNTLPQADVTPEAIDTPDADEENLSSVSAGSTPPPDSPGDELSASLRFSLRQKHSRHLADMKAYYENELTELKEKLTSLEAISQQDCYKKLERDNAKLRERCRTLEEELLRANRYINNVDKQMEDLENSFNASMSHQSRVDSAASTTDMDVYKSKLSAAESYIASLETRNKDLFSALCDAYEVRDNTARTATQESRRCQDLQERYDSLKKDQDSLSNKLQKTENCLLEAYREIELLKQNMRSDEDSRVNRLYVSPMLKAEHQHMYNLSSTPASPEDSRSNRSETIHTTASECKNTSANANLHNDLRTSQLHNSDTQSSESSRDHHKHKSNKKSSHSQRRTTIDKNTITNSDHMDLVSAYSPVVDRQRHSSSASSNGPVKTASSPQRQSHERPFGFHHVGAYMSPSKRTQQWAILSPFNRTPESSQHKSRKQTTPTSAKKSLDFSQQQISTSASAVINSQASKSTSSSDNIEDDVLKRIRAGKVYSDELDKSYTPTSSNTVSPSPITSQKKSSRVQEDRVKLMRDAETRLDELLMEKRQLESSLTRVSASHNRKDRQRQESLERQLDRVDKDLGSVRMTLRRYNIL